MASQEYAPWSSWLASGQLSSPNDLFSSSRLLVWLHFSGTWPQLSLQTTCGVGTPMAVQLIMKVKLWSTVIRGGGDSTMMGDPTSGT